MSPEIRQRIAHVFEEQKDHLLFYIRQKVGRIEDAEDILQDIFFFTLRGYSVTEPVENLAGWLFRAAGNRIVDYYRQKRHKPVRLETEGQTDLQTLLDQNGLNPEDQLLRRLFTEAVIDSIEQLPLKQQEVVILQMLEGYSFQEISEITGEPVNTLLSRKRYALKTLRKTLDEFKTFLEN